MAQTHAHYKKVRGSLVGKRKSHQRELEGSREIMLPKDTIQGSVEAMAQCTNVRA